MRNYSMEKGLVKNVRVQIVTLLPNVIQVRPLRRNQLQLHTRERQEEEPSTYYVPRIAFEFKPQRCNWTVQRRQFPLRLAYGTTFNSCQGLTLDRVVLDLRIPVFAHGQLYTSLSRIRSRSDIRILRDPTERHLSTSNIVHQVLLSQNTESNTITCEPPP